MSNWELLIAAVVLSLLTVLVAPAMWGSYATPGELLKRIRDDYNKKKSDTPPSP
jgi:hypothetical protein